MTCTAKARQGSRRPCPKPATHNGRCERHDLERRRLQLKLRKIMTTEKESYDALCRTVPR